MRRPSADNCKKRASLFLAKGRRAASNRKDKIQRNYLAGSGLTKAGRPVSYWERRIRWTVGKRYFAKVRKAWAATDRPLVQDAQQCQETLWYDSEKIHASRLVGVDASFIREKIRTHCQDGSSNVEMSSWPKRGEGSSSLIATSLHGFRFRRLTAPGRKPSQWQWMRSLGSPLINQTIPISIMTYQHTKSPIFTTNSTGVTGRSSTYWRSKICSCPEERRPLSSPNRKNQCPRQTLFIWQVWWPLSTNMTLQNNKIIRPFFS